MAFPRCGSLPQRPKAPLLATLVLGCVLTPATIFLPLILACFLGTVAYVIVVLRLGLLMEALSSLSTAAVDVPNAGRISDPADTMA